MTTAVNGTLGDGNVDVGDYDWGNASVEGMSRNVEPEMPLGNFGEMESNVEAEPVAETETQTQAEPGQVKPADIEELLVNGEGGKQKIKVDFSDREALKKMALEAHGMRKFAAERDKLSKSNKELQAELESIKPHWQKLDETFQRRGPEAVLDLLLGQEGALDRMVQERMAREGLRVKQPDEADRLDRLEQQAKERREREYEKAQQEKLTKSYEEKLARAEEKEVMSLLSPSFERHSVSGKLGDPIAEHRINKAVWNDVMETLSELDDAQITPQTIDREFRKAFSSFTRGVKAQAKTELSKVVQEAKTNAKQQIASKATAGMAEASGKNSLEQDYMSGKITGAQFFASMFQKKK